MITLSVWILIFVVGVLVGLYVARHQIDAKGIETKLALATDTILKGLKNIEAKFDGGSQ